MNGDRLKQVREILSLTQADLAESVGVTQGAIAQIEQGFFDPSPELVEKIVEKTGYPVGFFDLPPCQEFPLGSLLYRARRTLRSADKARLRQLARLVYSVAHTLMEGLRIPECRLPSLSEEPEKTAQVVRSQLGYDPDSPVRNLINRIEGAGVIVIALDEDVKEFDAFSNWVDDRAVIVHSRSRSGDRIRHSIAHELGHLVLHRSMRGDLASLDRSADVFANEFLLPREAMHRELPETITIAGLAELKPRWGTSIQSLVMCAKRLEVISETQYRNLHRQISRKGWKTKEPAQVIAEKPRLIKKMAEVKYGFPLNVVLLARDLDLPVWLAKSLLNEYAGLDDVSAHGQAQQQSGRVVSIVRRLPPKSEKAAPKDSRSRKHKRA